MKKQIITIGISALIVLSISGCTDWLTLKPENDVVLDDFWRKESDVETVLAACYRSLTEESCIERMIVWGEVRSDNIVQISGIPIERADLYRLLNGNLKQDNAYASWAPFYATINYCNVLLAYADQVVNLDENFTSQELDLVKGEAITLRSLAYFYLVRTFRDIPWTEDPGIDDTQNYSLAQEADSTILSRIIRDLEKVKTNNWVRDAYGNVAYDKGRITRNSLLTLLADVYLWKGDYAKCVENCNLVLKSPDLKLVADPDIFFSQVFYRGNSSESIFELRFLEDDMINTAVQNFYGSTRNNFTGYLGFPTPLWYVRLASGYYTGPYSPFNYKLINQTYESEADIRAKVSYYISNGSILKYVGASVTENPTSGSLTYLFRTNTPNWIVYRLSDVLLMKAEALVELSDGPSDNWTEALAMVNTTYMRANPNKPALSISNYSSKKDMEELVLRERQRELLFEGKRWFDLVRMARRENSVANLNRIVTIKMSGATASLGAPVMDALYMPISKKELQANKALKQNPYYLETSSSQR